MCSLLSKQAFYLTTYISIRHKRTQRVLIKKYSGLKSYDYCVVFSLGNESSDLKY